MKDSVDAGKNKFLFVDVLNEEQKKKVIMKCVGAVRSCTITGRALRAQTSDKWENAALLLC